MKLKKAIVLTALAAAVLTLIAVPRFREARRQAQLTECQNNLSRIGTALEMYAIDWAGRYPSSSDKLVPNYLKTIPTCPSAATVTYAFSMGFQPSLYTVVCGGHHHDFPDNYPQYTNIRGLDVLTFRGPRF